MALTMNPEAQAVFFEKLFSPTHPVVQRIKELIGKGVQFDTNLYTCKASYAGKTYQATLTIGTTSIMKGTVDAVVRLQNQAIIEIWINSLYHLDGSPKPPLTMKFEKESVNEVAPSQPTAFTVSISGVAVSKLLYVIKAIRQVSGVSLSVAKNKAELAQLGSTVEILVGVGFNEANVALKILIDAGATAIMTPVGKASVAPTPVAEVIAWAKAVPTPAVIQLKNAKALGQKVHGTSQGSVYYCVARSEHIRLAARILKGGSVSIRAEWNGASSAELEKLKESGMSMKGEYASIHLNFNDVPYSRVIGAFVVGTGIKWQEAVVNAEELVVE